MHNGLGQLLEVEMSKKCTLLCAKHILKSNVLKKNLNSDGLGPLWEVEMLKKCTPFWCEAHVQVKMFKKTTGSDYTTRNTTKMLPGAAFQVRTEKADLYFRFVP